MHILRIMVALGGKYVAIQAKLRPIFTTYPPYSESEKLLQLKSFHHGNIEEYFTYFTLLQCETHY